MAIPTLAVVLSFACCCIWFYYARRAGTRFLWALLAMSLLIFFNQLGRFVPTLLLIDDLPSGPAWMIKGAWLLSLFISIIQLSLALGLFNEVTSE